MKKFLLAGAAFAVISNSAFADSHLTMDESGLLSVASTWQNQAGSAMTISIGPNGWVSGRYVNAETDFGCVGGPGFPLMGWYLEGTISFTVIWKNISQSCHSMTGWTGYLTTNGTDLQFKTQWNLAEPTGDGFQILSGSDVFTYVHSAKLMAPAAK